MAYYRPIGWYTPIGYYSTLYLMTYYNGYGYNFYFGQYAYYEDSDGGDDGSATLIMVFTIICFSLVCCCSCLRVAISGGEEKSIKIERSVTMQRDEWR